MLILLASLLTAIVIMQLIAIQEENSNIELEASLIPVRVEEFERDYRKNWRSSIPSPKKDQRTYPLSRGLEQERVIFASWGIYSGEIPVTGTE